MRLIKIFEPQLKIIINQKNKKKMKNTMTKSFDLLSAIRRMVITLMLLTMGALLALGQTTGTNTGNRTGKVTELSPEMKNLLNYYDKQIHFTENKGQWPSDIYYKADFKLGQALATEKGMIVGTFDPKSIAEHDAQIIQEEKDRQDGKQYSQPSGSIKGHGWLMNFVNSSPDMSIETKGTHKDVFNYMAGGSNSSVMDVKNYKEVWYTNVYDNVDVRYYPSQEGTLEYDIVCKPGFDKNAIGIQFDGIDRIDVNREGHLTLSTSVGDEEFPAPVAYQKINGEKKSHPREKYVRQKALIYLVQYFPFS